MCREGRTASKWLLCLTSVRPAEFLAKKYEWFVGLACYDASPLNAKWLSDMAVSKVWVEVTAQLKEMQRQCLEVLSSLVPLPPWGGIGWAVIKKFGGVPPTQHASHRQDDCISSTEIAINVHLICHCWLRGRPKLYIILKEALNDGFSSRYVFCDVEGLIVEGRLIYWPQKSLQNNSAVNTFTLRDNTSHLQKVCGGLL